MKFIIVKASDDGYGCEKATEINTLEELMELVDKEGAVIIHNRERITIYDAYVE